MINKPKPKQVGALPQTCLLHGKWHALPLHMPDSVTILLLRDIQIIKIIIIIVTLR